MPDTFPPAKAGQALLLKEGWPDHLFIMIQMLIPAGVVDCCGFPSSSITCSITQPQPKWTCS